MNSNRLVKLVTTEAHIEDLQKVSKTTATVHSETSHRSVKEKRELLLVHRLAHQEEQNWQDLKRVTKEMVQEVQDSEMKRWTVQERG